MSRLTADTITDEEIDERPTVTVHHGDVTWHDGPGWYYVIDEYPDEGSCGAFKTRAEAEAHARNDGYEVAQDGPPDGVLTLSVRRGLYAIIYGDNGATAREVEAAHEWLRLQGVAV